MTRISMTRAAITCPACRRTCSAPIPKDACLFFYACTCCGLTLRPIRGDCCVLCSYGGVPCPPKVGEEAALRPPA